MGEESWPVGGRMKPVSAWMHMPASALTGLRTLGKLLYSLASVTSSCKRGVRAHTPGPARKASWSSYEAQLGPAEVSCSRLRSALSWIYWEMAASESPFQERLTQNGICQALLASQLSSFCRYSQIFSRHCPISLSGICLASFGVLLGGDPQTPLRPRSLEWCYLTVLCHEHFWQPGAASEPFLKMFLRA